MTTTIAAEGVVFQYQVERPPGLSTSCFTGSVSVSMVQNLLSDRPLERPVRSRPLRTLTNRELQQLAQSHRPPSRWFEGESESPF